MFMKFLNDLPTGQLLGTPPPEELREPGETWLPFVPSNEPFDPAFQERILFMTPSGEVAEYVVGKPEPQYRIERRAAYPDIADQLDMIYQDFEGWRAMIASIKAQHPKPTG